MSEASTNPNIIETSEATFERDVIERSKDVPVVVDFWATWCQPCRILGPILEKLAREGEGKFVLVKAETELVPNIAAGFGVRSIPAVFGIKDGRVVDSFLGALPESAIRAWGRSSPDVAEVVTRVDRRRERHVVEAIVALGVDRTRARLLGRIAIDLLVGIQTREVTPEPRRVRQMLEEIIR